MTYRRPRSVPPVRNGRPRGLNPRVPTHSRSTRRDRPPSRRQPDRPNHQPFMPSLSPFRSGDRHCCSCCPPGRSRSPYRRRDGARRDLVVRGCGCLVHRPSAARTPCTERAAATCSQTSFWIHRRTRAICVRSSAARSGAGKYQVLRSSWARVVLRCACGSSERRLPIAFSSARIGRGPPASGSASPYKSRSLGQTSITPSRPGIALECDQLLIGC